jgi:hypothetical protein
MTVNLTVLVIGFCGIVAASMITADQRTCDMGGVIHILGQQASRSEDSAHALDHLSWLFCLIVSLPSPWRAAQIRDIRVAVAFEVLDVVSGTASGVFSTDALVFVSSRVCIVHAR